jgi:hypothetical protein
MTDLPTAMSEAPAFLAGWLETEGNKIAALFKSLTDAQWQSSIHTEGKTWIVRDVLAHLTIAEIRLPEMFADICAGGSGLPAGLNLDALQANQLQSMSDLSPQELLEQYKATHAKIVAFVTGLSAADLEKRGHHPFMGITTLAEMVKGVCIHTQIHLRDLSRIR